MSALQEWHHNTLINDDHLHYLPTSYILSEEAINKLASLSPCTESAVKGYLSQQWVFWSTYGSDVTAVIISSQPQCEKIVPSSNSQNEDQIEGLGIVHISRDATRHSKQMRSCSPMNISTESGSQQQKQARRAVTNTPKLCNATNRSPS